MDFFSEFNTIIKCLQESDIRYAVVGGLAVAIHGGIRSTKDMDFLIYPDDHEPFEILLRQLGYICKSDPWTFKDSNITLHRFFKREEGEEDFYMVDLMVANSGKDQAIIDQADEDLWGSGVVKMARRGDLIKMKEKRGSHSDLEDIEVLRRGDEEE